MEQRRIRQSNFELLRIICMLMVVGLHYFGKGGARFQITPRSCPGNYFVTNLFLSLFIPAVNCFVLISGYFGIRLRLQKLFKLECELLFYSVSLFALLVVLKLQPFRSRDFLLSFFPVLTREWWFVSIYVVLFLIAPFLNLLIEKMTQKQYVSLLAVMFFLFCLWPTFSTCSVTNDTGAGICNFVFMYLTGGYIARYCHKSVPKIRYLLLYFGSSLLSLLCSFISALIFHYNTSRFYGFDTLFTVISAVSLFLFFREISLRSKPVNKISSMLLAVYLIHDHPGVRAYIWSKIFRCGAYFYQPFFVFHFVLTTLTIFLSCLTVEWIRVSFFHRLEDRAVQKVSSFGIVQRFKTFSGT